MERTNYFALIMHQLNKHGVSRRWLTVNDFKHIKSGALRTITNIIKKEYILW